MGEFINRLMGEAVGGVGGVVVRWLQWKTRSQEVSSTEDGVVE